MRYLLTAFLSLFLLTFLNSCQKEVSVETGSPARGSLQGNGGDCLPKTVSGSYMANKALTDSNFIEVSVTVLAAGPYTIATDTLNGYSFKAAGTFAAAGVSTVKLKGSGKPTIAGVDNFTVVFDSSYCEVAITVLPAGSTGGPATFTLVTTGTGCTAFDLQGAYMRDSTLSGSNKVGVQVNVTATGTYSITTNTVNGYLFSATGSFSTTGVQTVFLQGAGKPITAQTDNFTVTAGALTCAFPVIVQAAGTSACGITPQGTYTAGTTLTSTNKVVLTHNYTNAGSVTVSTGTLNGYSFGPATIMATAGSNTITLNGTGTPTAVGTNSFTVNFGDGTSCTFSVTVGSGTPPVTGTDYFPLTLNSWWSYDIDGDPNDTFKLTNRGPVTLGTTTFQRFVSTDGSIVLDTTYYRKDAAGNYYLSVDTSGSGPDVTFSTPRVELLFLKNTLITNQTWNSDISATYLGNPVTLRFKYTCIDANATLVINGKTFTSVYKVDEAFELGQGGVFLPSGNPVTTTYYAKGIGQIKLTDGTYTNNIRFWQVF